MESIFLRKDWGDTLQILRVQIQMDCAYLKLHAFHKSHKNQLLFQAFRNTCAPCEHNPVCVQGVQLVSAAQGLAHFILIPTLSIRHLYYPHRADEELRFKVTKDQWHSEAEPGTQPPEHGLYNHHVASLKMLQKKLFYLHVLDFPLKGENHKTYFCFLFV